MKQALRDGDKIRLTTLRLLVSAFQKKEKDDNIADLDDAASLVVIKRLARQYQNAIEQYRAAGSDDRAAKEEAEMSIVSAYIPEPLAESAQETMIQDAIAETNATSLRDMGKVMALLRERSQGQVDMASASAKVKAHLAASEKKDA